MLFVFIGGASASGKTLLASKLVEQLNCNGIHAIKVSMDHYYKTAIDFGLNIKDACLDSPDAIDMNLLIEQLRKLEARESVAQPLYSFVLSDRLAETVLIDPHDTDVIVLEGILALHVCSLFKPKNKMSIFVMADHYTYYLQRRCERDIAERMIPMDETRRRELKKSGVRDSFFKHILPTRHNADIVVTNNYRVLHSTEINKEDITRRMDQIIKKINAVVSHHPEEFMTKEHSFK